MFWGYDDTLLQIGENVKIFKDHNTELIQLDAMGKMLKSITLF